MTFKASGNVFYSSNAATFSNVTIGGGTLKILGELFQGTVAGFAAGGTNSGFTLINNIEKYPFATDTNAIDTVDLISTSTSRATSGHSSITHGYASGGWSPGVNTIQRFPFATSTNASDVGDLTGIKAWATGTSSSEFGYVTGGTTAAGTYPGYNVIERFPFSSSANAADVGDLTRNILRAAGQSSTSSGYTSGGQTTGAGTATNTIDKFPFASNANATDVGDLTVARSLAAGQSSLENGYTSGGYLTTPTKYNVIDKFSFASNANASDVGDILGASFYYSSGTSSTVSGYTAGAYQNTKIVKFSFASNGNSTDVGNLVAITIDASGSQD